MSVKIDKLWKDSWFQSQEATTKLLYLYLITNPNLNTVGVFSPNIEVACIEINCSIEQFRQGSTKLIEKKLLYVKKYNSTIYFILPAHFSAIPKSESSVSRVNKILQGLPEELVSFLESIGISVNSKVVEFKRPTSEEVAEYAMSLGHLISGDEFIKYYDEQSNRYGKKDVWVDGRGTQVRDWKAKLRKIWFKDDNKLKVVDGAPKGFETFFIVDKGVILTPDGWRNGKPWSKSLPTDITLKREYERRVANS